MRIKRNSRAAPKTTAKSDRYSRIRVMGPNLSYVIYYVGCEMAQEGGRKGGLRSCDYFMLATLRERQVPRACLFFNVNYQNDS